MSFGLTESDRIELARAYGFAHRALEVPNTAATRFAIASGSKGFTALAVVRLVEDGVLGTRRLSLRSSVTIFRWSTTA